MVENQWIQWVPLFGFGSVVTILIAIFGVGIGLWRNASIAHRNISDNINRVESRLESRMHSEFGSLGSRLESRLESDLGSLGSKLGSEMGSLESRLGEAWNPGWDLGSLE